MAIFSHIKVCKSILSLNYRLFITRIKDKYPYSPVPVFDQTYSNLNILKVLLTLIIMLQHQLYSLTLSQKTDLIRFVTLIENPVR